LMLEAYVPHFSVFFPSRHAWCDWQFQPARISL
jgi:hypothetical protein